MNGASFPPLAILGMMQVAALLPIGLLDPDDFPDKGWFCRSHAVAIVFGCGFAQASVAAAWAALGPGSLAFRWPRAAAWALAAAGLLAANILVHGSGAEGPWEALLLGGTFFGVWLVVQGPLWMARALYRLELRSPIDTERGFRASENQFGIRQLMIVTTSVAATLGLGRLLVAAAPNEPFGSSASYFVEMVLVSFLFVFCNSLVAFTVITGTLLQRQWLFGVTLGFSAAAAVTLVEWNLFASLVGGPDKWDSLVMVGGMNGLQFAWLLTSLLVVRGLGYRLAAGPIEAALASDASPR